MTTRRQALAAMLASAAAMSRSSRAQSRALPRLGYVHPGSAEGSAIYKALIPGLADLGYVNGRSIILELRSGKGKPEAIPVLVADVIATRPDVLLVVGPAAAQAAVAASKSIPIVAVDLESDPVQNGWMKSMSRPSGNLTGFFLDLSAMAAKWLQLLREAAPAARKIALLWDASTGNTQIAATRSAARTLDIDVEPARVGNWNKLDDALTAAERSGAQAIVVLSSPTAFQYSDQIAAFTRKTRMPAISPFRPFAVAGGLMSYGPNLDVFFRRIPFAVDRLLKGAKAADVAAEQPTQYELVINLRTAKMIGLAIPQTLLLRADEVIQ